MTKSIDAREVMTLEEAAISNMWEIAAIVELLERKGLCSKQDLYAIINDLRRKQPAARIPETVFPEPYLLTETENKLLDQMLALLNEQGLTPHQAMQLLRRLESLIAVGGELAKKIEH